VCVGVCSCFQSTLFAFSVLFISINRECLCLISFNPLANAFVSLLDTCNAFCS